MFKQIFRKIAPNPLDRLLKKAVKNHQKKFFLCWNRGMGDIPLGLYAIIYRIRELVPDCSITFLTRPNLKEGFTLLENIEILVAPNWTRKKPYSIAETLSEMGINPRDYDVFIEHPDPTYWVKWQRGKLIPKLKWDEKWDLLWKKYDLKEDQKYIGVHPHAETQYGFDRNFPAEKWQALFDLVTQKHPVKILLFGFEKDPKFSGKGIIDLRGETNLYELLSVIKNRCFSLIMLDSGVGAMTYYLDASFPIRLISLWGNPDMGILKQNVPSPNLLLQHIPILGRDENINTIEIAEVERAIFYDISK